MHLRIVNLMDLKGIEPNAYLSSKWHHVMLTKREYLNILHDDQLIMVLMEYGTID